MKKTTIAIILAVAIIIVMLLLSKKSDKSTTTADETREYGSNIRVNNGTGDEINQDVVNNYTTMDYRIIAEDAHQDAKTMPYKISVWIPVATIDRAHWHNLVEAYQYYNKCAPAADINKCFGLSNKTLKTGFYKASFDGIREALKERITWL